MGLDILIFISTGTAPWGFNRLILLVDQAINNNWITESVFGQIGGSSIVPLNFKYKRYIPYKEMEFYIQNSSIIITHCSDIVFEILKRQKKCIVVPRYKELNEVVNNKQLELADELEKLKYIIVVRNSDNLKSSLEQISNFNIRPFESNLAKFQSHLINYINNKYVGE